MMESQPNRPTGNSATGGNLSITCYRCRRQGHIASECPERPVDGRGGNRNSSNANSNRRAGTNAITSGDARDEFPEVTNTNDPDYYPSGEENEENERDDDYDSEFKYSSVVNVEFCSMAGINVIENKSTQEPPNSKSSVSRRNVEEKSTRPIRYTITAGGVSNPLWATAKLAGIEKVKAIFDTGSGITLLSWSVFKRLPEYIRTLLEPADYQFDLSSATGTPMNQKGFVALSLSVGMVEIKPIWFGVIENLANDLLIGNDVLSQKELFGGISVGNQEIEYFGNGIKEIIQVSSSKKTPGPEKKDSSERKSGRRLKETNPHHVIGSVRLINSLSIPARSEIVIPAKETKVKGIGHFRDSYVFPRQAKLGEKFKLPILLVEKHPALKGAVSVINSVNGVTDELLKGETGVSLHLSNMTNNPIRLRSGTKVAVIEAADERESATVNSIFPSEANKLNH